MFSIVLFVEGLLQEGCKLDASAVLHTSVRLAQQLVGELLLIGDFGFGEEFPFVQPDPVVLEINRLQNLLKEKDRELATSQGEIKALRATEALKDKAIEEDVVIAAPMECDL
ncbi:Microtubule-associated protein 70-5 [Senna tora]|uniref:Microtubule-associated protein 70-5 n=1 Tax=Senna tora TaxID=362788 RepID=A0A834X766_9FABA|nr:Microtubule-associated protein 70-5 [Senna tora]